MCSLFEKLSKIDVSDKVQQKGKFTYLSWAYAWGELKKHYPEANYKVYETPEGRLYFDDGNTAWVKVSVTIEYLEHIEYLPIMNFNNKALKLAEITSFEANKAIQRALTKAIARHGLGLYIYAGEDLPEKEERKTFAESHSPAPESGAEEIYNELKNSSDIEYISEGQVANFCIKQQELGIADEKVKEMLKANGYSHDGSRKHIVKSKFLQAKKAMESMEGAE